MVDSEKILKYAEREGAQEAEIISENSKFTYVKVSPGGSGQVVLGDTTKYALRAVVDGAVGFAYFTANEKDAVKGAVSFARTREKSEKWRSFPPDKKGCNMNLYRASIKDVPVERIVADMKLTGEAIQDEKVIASTMGCQLVSSTVEVLSTSGVNKRESRSLSTLWVTCRAFDIDYGMSYSYNYSLDYDIDLYEKGLRAKEDALRQLGKKKTEPGKKMVILSPRVFTNLLVTAALPSFLGHNVARGRTTLHMGKEVASESITITENPLTENPQGRSFDDEGVPSQNVTLVDKMCVQNFLYDNYHGESTGSGIRFAQYHGRSLRYGPRPCATSISVAGESASLDALISQVTDGLLIIDEANSHVSKQQTGQFSIAVTSGFIIKNGEICSPVKRCMVSGSAFKDLLPQVMQISTERELHRNSVYPTYVETGYILVDSLSITA
ncbi:MAG: TldD/PmbA family protein [Theionarchaea archaeon]|nr:TldD/PmbA family protein [Theionarchaea archaeon]